MRYCRRVKMGIHTEYSCSECGFKFEDSSDIFWIDDKGFVHVGMQVASSSGEVSKALASGGIFKFYCYNCRKFIHNFHVTEKSDELSRENIIQLIENYNDSSKIIDFDNKFQNCIYCGDELPLRLKKAFALDCDGKFHIGDVELNDFEDMPLDFSGRYYGYFCKKCSKQINKFVVLENPANLEDGLIREILRDHTNDLTVFIDGSYEFCPECGDILQVLGDSSLCPKCRIGVLVIVNREFVD